jgi:hypothetical protein
MSENQEVATEKVLANIIRGRMPVAVVFLVRHGDNRNEATKALADLFGTTVGKVDDIKKCRNFGYVTASFKPTAEQKADGIAWLQRHPKFNEGTVDKLINELEALEVASAEEAAAFVAARTEARGQSEKTKTGEVADAGGGNRRGKGKKAKAAPSEEAAPAADGDALLD